MDPQLPPYHPPLTTTALDTKKGSEWITINEPNERMTYWIVEQTTEWLQNPMNPFGKWSDNGMNV